MAKLAKNVGVGVGEDTPEPLKKSRALRSIYDNLKNVPEFMSADSGAKRPDSDDPMLDLALAIDETIRHARPDDWRDNGGPKELTVKDALFQLLDDQELVEHIFPIIKEQKDY